jgi:threonine dehydratase
LPREIAFDTPEVQHAAERVHRVLPPTPQYAWPKLARRAGCTLWVKHENRAPTGAFEVRGGLVYLDLSAARMVEVSEDPIAEAMRVYFDDTHQIAEGAGATPSGA